MNLNKTFWWITAALFLAVIISCLQLPMVVNAAKYAQVSREMLERGDWINLTIAGDAYDQKPPLLFWLGAVFFGLFGMSTAIWKIAAFLVSLVGIYSTYRLGKLLYGETAGRLSALFWALSLGYIYYHNDIHTDTLLADTVIFSIWQFARWIREGKEGSFYVGMVATGLSMLAKGPVGLAIPAFAVGTHILLHRQWKSLLHFRWIIAIVIITVMIIPALWGLFNQFGTEGIKFYFWTNNMGRITGSYYRQNADPFFYFHTTLYILAPFTIFALWGVTRQIIAAIKTKGRFAPEQELLTLGGIIPYFLILSVAQTKNPHYLVPITPLFMIQAALFVVALSKGEVSQRAARAVRILNWVVVAVLWAIIPLFAGWFFPESRAWYWMIVASLAALLVTFCLKYKGMMRQVAILTVSIITLMLSLHVSFYPRMSEYHSPFHAVKLYNEMVIGDERIHIYRKPARYWEIFFYGKNPGRYYVTPEELPALLENGRDWVFTDAEGMKEITEKLPATEIIRQYDHRSISQMTPKFLMPATRASKLDKMFLLHLP